MLNLSGFSEEIEDFAEDVMGRQLGRLEHAVLTGDAQLLESVHQVLWASTRAIGQLRLQLMVLEEAS